MDYGRFRARIKNNAKGLCWELRRYGSRKLRRKKIRGGLRDIYLVQITSARQQVVKPDQQIGYQGNGVWSVTE
jgi:hypothetical protein